MAYIAIGICNFPGRIGSGLGKDLLRISHKKTKLGKEEIACRQCSGRTTAIESAHQGAIDSAFPRIVRWERIVVRINEEAS